MYPRLLLPVLLEALDEAPAVFLTGPRQAGKTTLALEVARRRGLAYRTLDDPTELAAARGDPAAYVDALQLPAVLDEAQRAPEIFLPLKARLDREREPGRVLLTGSANVLFLPRVADALVGRVRILTLLPLSQAELERGTGGFLSVLASGRFPDPPPLGDLSRRILRGGFPPAVAARKPEAWFASYLDALLARDVRELAQIERLHELPNLLALLASRSGTLLNYSALARESGLPTSTLKRYLALLRALFLTYELPAWSSNLGKRLLKSPKLHLVDTGLAAYLLGIGTPRRDRVWGSLYETFVAGELKRLLTGTGDLDWRMHHYRDASGREVDLVLEARDGRVIALEAKAQTTLGQRDFRHLRWLSAALGDRFLAGGVVYPGSRVVSFGPRLWALPVSLLWL